MAITRLKRKDGTIYYAVDYRYPRVRGGEKRRETAPTRDEADALWGTILKELLADRDPRVTLGKTGTFADHAREVLAKHYGDKRSQPFARIVIEKHLIPAFGKTPLAKITVKRVIDYMDQRRALGRARATVDNERAVLSKVLSLAVDWDLLAADANPMRKVPKLGEHGQRDRVLRPEEQRALIAAGDTNRLRHARDAAIVSLGTGGRHKEVVGLRWQDVDLERGLITFIAGNTKNGKARTVPANDALLAMLKTRHAARPQRERFGPGEGHVFTYRGKPVASINGAFRTLAKDAGLGRDVTFHTLRHTFATRFGHLGGDPRDLMAIGGWSDMKIVERYYHPGADRSTRAMAAMAGDLIGTVPIPGSATP
ncbi:MAG TPA: tyrosine-type recombinase/integrase [Dongiaceae bacterium]|nr:tyrosine-type recombinase/integrase [Dongiaceae bacterium]